MSTQEPQAETAERIDMEIIPIAAGYTLERPAGESFMPFFLCLNGQRVIVTWPHGNQSRLFASEDCPELRAFAASIAALTSKAAAPGVDERIDFAAGAEWAAKMADHLASLAQTKSEEDAAEVLARAIRGALEDAALARPATTRSEGYIALVDELVEAVRGSCEHPSLDIFDVDAARAALLRHRAERRPAPGGDAVVVPEELRKLSEGAPGGPWKADETRIYFEPSDRGGFDMRNCPKPAGGAAFIAAAVNFARAALSQAGTPPASQHTCKAPGGECVYTGRCNTNRFGCHDIAAAPPEPASPHRTTTAECLYFRWDQCCFNSNTATNAIQPDRCTQCPGLADTATEEK